MEIPLTVNVIDHNIKMESIEVINTIPVNILSMNSLISLGAAVTCYDTSFISEYY